MVNVQTRYGFISPRKYNFHIWGVLHYFLHPCLSTSSNSITIFLEVIINFYFPSYHNLTTPHISTHHRIVKSEQHLRVRGEPSPSPTFNSHTFTCINTEFADEGGWEHFVSHCYCHLTQGAWLVQEIRLWKPSGKSVLCLRRTRHKKILRSPRNPVHISHSLWVVLLPFCHSNFGPGMLSKHDNLVCMGQGVVLF